MLIWEHIKRVLRRGGQPQDNRPIERSVPWPPIPQRILDEREVFVAARRVVECWHKWQYRRITVIDAPIEQLELALDKLDERSRTNESS